MFIRPHCLISSSSFSFSHAWFSHRWLHSSLNISLSTTIWAVWHKIKHHLSSLFCPWLMFDLLDHLHTWGRSPQLNWTEPTDWLTDWLPLSNDLTDWANCSDWTNLSGWLPDRKNLWTMILILIWSELTELNWRPIKNDGLTEWYSWP